MLRTAPSVISDTPASPLSKVLGNLQNGLPPDLTTGTLVEALRERGVGALMVLFALLVMIPIPASSFFLVNIVTK
ncbi:MAG: exopolysaccharide biosynthesis protein [Candidatus Micrarchaeaceae archaeon]